MEDSENEDLSDEEDDEREELSEEDDEEEEMSDEEDDEVKKEEIFNKEDEVENKQVLSKDVEVSGKKADEEEEVFKDNDDDWWDRRSSLTCAGSDVRISFLYISRGLCPFELLLQISIQTLVSLKTHYFVLFLKKSCKSQTQ